MENFDLNSIFNLNLDDFKESEKKQSRYGNFLFKPDSKSGKDGVYKAVIRFIPWHKDVKKSIMKKWSCWLTNSATDESKMVDCPSTIGKKSILQDLYWKFKNSESVAEQKIADNFSRRQCFASLVQIIKDDNAPENVGKIMIWQYGVKIHNKLQAEMKPEFGKPHIPFDLFEGKPFLVHIPKIGGYNNYDNCRFLDEKMPITIDGERMEKTPECMEKIEKFLKASPDLSMFDYNEWDEETENFVNDVIRNVVPGGKVIEKVEARNKGRKDSDDDLNFFTKTTVSGRKDNNEKVEVKNKNISKKDSDDDDLNFFTESSTPIVSNTSSTDDYFNTDSFDDELYAAL